MTPTLRLRVIPERNALVSMEISFFDSVLPWFRGVGVSKRRTQAGTLVLGLMGRCAGLKRPCTAPCLEGRAKKDISMLFSPVSFLRAALGGRVAVTGHSLTRRPEYLRLPHIARIPFYWKRATDRIYLVRLVQQINIGPL